MSALDPLALECGDDVGLIDAGGDPCRRGVHFGHVAVPRNRTRLPGPCPHRTSVAASSAGQDSSAAMGQIRHVPTSRLN
jgi:hypothetical protein